MDGKAWNQRDVAVQGHQATLDARALTYEHAASKRKRPIKPGVVHHPTVRLGVEAQVIVGALDLARHLNLEARRIRVRSRKLEVIRSSPAIHTGRSMRLGQRPGLRRALVRRGIAVCAQRIARIGARTWHLGTYTPGNHARTVALRIVGPTRPNIPSRSFGQVDETRLVQAHADRCSRMKHRRTFMNKVEHFLDSGALLCTLRFEQPHRDLPIPCAVQLA